LNQSAISPTTQRSVALFLFLSLVAVFQVSCNGDHNRTVEMTVGEQVFRLEIADDPDERAQGLMGREELPENHGMLFVFPDIERRSFWMKDTLIPLSIAYINRHGEILEIHQMEPLSRDPVPSRYPVQYALEVPRGNFERLGIAPGDSIDLDALPSWVDPR
jgi:uncharacterized protein